MKIGSRTRKALAAGFVTAVAVLLATQGPLSLHGQPEAAPAGPAEQPGAARLAVEARIANARCPIMATPLDGELVPERMTRHWNGMKIGFSSGSCLLTWDRLGDQERHEKLSAAMR